MQGNDFHNLTKRPKLMTKGFTMIELMISLSVGLVLFAGVLSIFVGMRTTTAETSSFGELQENGRFALSMLTDDLLKQDFWGDYSGILTVSNLTIGLPDAPAPDCIGGGINNRTFPLATGHFRTLWGQTLTDATPNLLGAACFSTPPNTRTKAGSDVIQLKRVIGNPVDVISAVDPINLLPVTNAENYYFMSSVSQGGIFRGGAAMPVLDNFRTWIYQHHVYYVRERSVGSDFVPVLMQGRLVNGGMSFEPIIDGIEVIRFMYGVDTNGDGVINSYLSADAMGDAQWDGAGGSKILAVKVYVLARSILPDNKYENTNTYQLGDLLIDDIDDNYRRLLFSSTVTLYNARVN